MAAESYSTSKISVSIVFNLSCIPPVPLYITSHQRAGLSRENAEGGRCALGVLLMCDNNVHNTRALGRSQKQIQLMYP